MDFAADAVSNVIAPQMRAAPARDLSESGSSFAEHLDAAVKEAEAQRDPAAAPAAPTDDQILADDGLSLCGLAVCAAPPPAAPPLSLQLVVTPSSPQRSDLVNAASAEPPSAGAPTQQLPTVPDDSRTPPTAATTQSAPAAGDAKTSGEHAQSKTTPESAQATPPITLAPAPAPALQQEQAPVVEEILATPSKMEAVQIAASPLTPRPASPEHAAPSPKMATAHSDGEVEPPAAPEPPRSSAPQSTVQSTSVRPLVAPSAPNMTTIPAAPDSADPMQQMTPATAGPSSHVAHAQQASSDATGLRALPAVHQVAREIIRRFEGGDTRFELRLDPPELGRVEVRLDVSRDHRVSAVIAADNPQALTELARHARDLEQMLQSAGLELSDSGLSFDLRQGGEQAESLQHDGARADRPGLTDDLTPTVARPLGYERWRGVRVDMMV